MEVQEHALKRPSPLKGPKSPLQLSPAVVAHSPPPAASPPPPHTHHTHTLTTHTLHTHAHRKLFVPVRLQVAPRRVEQFAVRVCV